MTIICTRLFETLSLTLLASALAVAWGTGLIGFSPATTQAATRATKQTTKQATKQATKQTWEYKSTIKVLSYDKQLLGNSEVRDAKCFDKRAELKCDTMLNTLGAQGWELVSVFGESLVGGSRDWAGSTTAETFVFKRTTD